MRSRCDPSLEEFGLVVADLPRARHRHDDRDVHFPVADVHYSEIAIVIHVHLAHVRDALHLPVVRDESNSPWPEAARFYQTQPASNDGAQPISTDDVPGPERARLPIGREGGDATHPRRSISGEIGDAHGFFDTRSGRARAAEHDFVENRPPDGEAFVAKPVEAVIGRKLSDGDVAVGGANYHPGEMRRIASLDFVEHTHVREDSRRLRAQILGADLVARELRPVEDENIHSFTRERPGRGCAGRSAADYYDFRVEVLAHAIQSRARPAGTIPCIASVAAGDEAPMPRA